MDGTRPVVFQVAEFDQLIDTILGQNGEHRVYAQDMRPLHEQRRVAETVMVVMVLDGWAGAYYRGEDRHAWITYTPRPSLEAPELLYDPYTGSTFPPDAVIPADQLRTAIDKYLETGQRPTSVQWREPDRYLIY
jgi:hypothetical protein